VDKKKLSLFSLMIGSVGVVYGDIGTSPLYALKVCFNQANILPTPDNIMGIMSLIFWALAIVVTIKYIMIVMKADNNGEGGAMALVSLIMRSNNKKLTGLAVVFGIAASSLFYGDGVITPAISVLGALEGLEVISPKFHIFILPLSIIIILMLFMLQNFGTALIGRFFGPLMIIWFLSIGALGLVKLSEYPGILKAINPSYAFAFFSANGLKGFLVLGGIIMVVTGAEALYADIGHFGKTPIRVAWFVLVYPALIFNYCFLIPKQFLTLFIF
jgi:KUP system potassium uptake protein